MRNLVMNVLSEDPTILRDLVEDAKHDLQRELLEDLQKYQESIHDELIIMNGQYGFVEQSVVREAALRICGRKFDGRTVSEWCVHDTQGVVYGWQEEVFLFVVESEHGPLVVRVTAHVDVTQLGSVLRLVELYKATTNTTDPKVAIITPSISEQANALAEERNVLVLAF